MKHLSHAAAHSCLHQAELDKTSSWLLTAPKLPCGNPPAPFALDCEDCPEQLDASTRAAGDLRPVSPSSEVMPRVVYWEPAL